MGAGESAFLDAAFLLTIVFFTAFGAKSLISASFTFLAIEV